jgi:hypothetical protein
VLNFLSARYFARDPDSLALILKISARYGFCNSSSYGVLLAQYFLLRAMFLNIDSSYDQVRKLVFCPIFLQNFLETLCVKSISNIDPLLKKSKISFGYFEHFPLNPIEKPFDLMARCLFKGSAVTLDESFPGLNLMIPLVLEDGRVSFLGVHVENVKEKYISENVQGAMKEMTFFNIFNYQNDRPFIMIIFAHCNSDLKIYVETSPFTPRNPMNNPDVLVFKGKPQYGMSVDWLNKAPSGIMYHGIDESYLKGGNKMLGLVKELPFDLNSDEENSDSDQSDQEESDGDTDDISSMNIGPSNYGKN